MAQLNSTKKITGPLGRKKMDNGSTTGLGFGSTPMWAQEAIASVVCVDPMAIFTYIYTPPLHYPKAGNGLYIECLGKETPYSYW